MPSGAGSTRRYTGRMNSTHAALLLLHTPGLGPAAAQRLLATFGNCLAIVNAKDSELRTAGLQDKQLSAFRQIGEHDIAADLEWAQSPNNHLIPCDSPAYPAQLLELSDAPPLLFVTGDPEVLKAPQIALIGSRNPSAGGIENAERFAAELAGRGLCITSGLASGIDAASHRGALSVDGLSIAVTGTGLDRVYPAANRELAHQLADQGALVSEFPVGTPPRSQNFPRRNRLISALSSGVLVIEATVRSGSLITARLASEQGREVLAVPGSIHNPMARGCHALIRQGAKLVETADDVLEELASQIDTRALLSTRDGPTTTPVDDQSTAAEDAEEDEDYAHLIQCLGHDPVSVDALIERTGLSSAALSSMLLMLELTGRVHKASGGRYALNASNSPPTA